MNVISVRLICVQDWGSAEGRSDINKGQSVVWQRKKEACECTVWLCVHTERMHVNWILQLDYYKLNVKIKTVVPLISVLIFVCIYRLCVGETARRVHFYFTGPSVVLNWATHRSSVSVELRVPLEASFGTDSTEISHGRLSSFSVFASGTDVFEETTSDPWTIIVLHSIVFPFAGVLIHIPSTAIISVHAVAYSCLCSAKGQQVSLLSWMLRSLARMQTYHCQHINLNYLFNDYLFLY